MNTTQEISIAEGNKIIAEFDDEIIISKTDFWKYRRENKVFTSKGLKYHSSWDWLMPVVDKIGHIINGADEELSKQLDEFKPMIWDLRICHPHIEYVWTCVIDFIQWYNNQNKKQNEYR